ncbi:MAG: DUF814 domain-containing protein [Nanoarchaeota archaeon]|nr:DUF814 domain-containing protein [Nanoarchaeota archaeon]MBU1321531.1 DUF814 domain-containing protein [Nanoarchaeota archaeon]MBU1597159.1 DUF814 domain-containing protein [Nanoarchaeota archaeon]MBU2441156.1 DUF814 domain-containing protein [Nanoarchaeota archaeon]
MEISLDIRKSVEENAAEYFEKSKKAKKKIEGVEKAIDTYKKKLSSLEEQEVEKKTVVKKNVKKEWFEKFRWFVSSDGFLVIGGRDATTNEIVIKKYSDKDDLVFHTDMRGSPFVIVKRELKKGELPESTMREAAEFTAVFSKGWKMGMSTIDVFYVKPDQVSKQIESGGTLTKGAFMIYGETKYYHPGMSYAIGIYDGKVMGGPLSAVKKNCKEFVEIEQGNEKLSDVAKLIRKKIGGELDDILRALPAGSKVKG